ncbi:MAG: metal ABC transporter permease [Brevirhabdus sp.]
MFDDFLVRAVLAGLGVSLAAGPLGTFVVWRRMAYFSDATSHAAVLGVAIALASGLPVFVGAALVALAMALAVTALARAGESNDAALGVLSHSGLAIGLVAVTFIPGVRVDIEAFLFGDILTVPKGELALIWGAALSALGLLIWRWRALLTATVSEELAAASGIRPQREQLILSLALAILVAVSIKVVGALLIGALLIIPAAAARGPSRTPESMAFLATGIAALSVVGGLWASFTFDTPAGPSMVAAAAAVYVVLLGVRRRG